MRRLKYPPKPKKSAAEALEDTLAKMPKKRSKSPKANLSLALAEAELFRQTGDWSLAKPLHFVALYAWLHEQIYGTEPVDLLDGKSLLAAQSAAGKMLRVDFDGNEKRFVEFIAWCWSRERESIKKGRETNRRLTWRLQFATRHLLVDYRTKLIQRGR